MHDRARLIGLSSLLMTLMACSADCPEGSYEGADGLCHLEDEDSETTPPVDTSLPVDTSKPPEDTADTSQPPEDTADTAGDTGKGVVPVEGIPSRLGVRDYGFAFWPGNHWTNWGSYDDMQYIQTGYYGLALDIASWSFDHFGIIDAEIAVDDALQQDNSLITDLPTASLSYSITNNGFSHVADGFYNPDGSSTNPSQIIDMGRFMQRTEIPQVGYIGSSLSGSLQVASMPRHLVLTHRVDNLDGLSNLDVNIELSGDAVSRYANTDWLDGTRAVSITDDDGNGWSFIIPEQDGLSGTISRAADGALSFTSTQSGDVLSQVSLSVIALPSHAVTDTQRSVWLNPADQVTVQYAQKMRDGSAAEDLVSAEFDPERGVYLISLRDLSAVGAPGSADWTDPNNHNWYNRHRLVIENNSTETLSVPLVFDGGNNAAFYIVGGSPMLRDTSGEPTGVPVQISKNWHESPFWYHLYSTMELEPGSHEFEHTFAHSKWGDAYAAAHAQLSLIGWGTATHGDQQWDESSLGAFGESVTYDPDLTLSRSMVDDIRPFQVDASGEWGWTGNVGGANFLVYSPAEGYTSLIDHQLGRLRTHYAYNGPNLTNVTYAGVSRDGKIEARLTTQLGRTDDLIRVYYHMEYTFLEDVTYDRLALFQVAADRYSDNGFTRYAYGDATGTLFDADINSHATTGYAAESDRGIALTGESPWVMLYASDRNDSGSLYENLGNIGFVIRNYEATIGGVKTTTPHINIMQTYNIGYSQMSFELGVPYDASSPVVPAGSVVHATVEYLVPPSDKDAYYGESDHLTAMASDRFNTTDMLQALATGNHLEVTATVGSLSRTSPVELEAAVGETAVQFSLTGGLGYTPVTIHGLTRPDGWKLEQLVKGSWERVDQSVEGNDYWQAYDNTAAGSFDLVFNLHNIEATEYRLVR
ncbi:MAG: hypothetical protein P8R54_03270 [Myxococcota bacterium]|nr:hypothetical protein [Myxococcota bacterium]